MIVRAYHGTTVTHADEFLGVPPAPLYISRNRHDWLGDGMYFWQDAPRHAWKWAIDQAPSRSDPRPAVVGALLEFDESISIDLLDFTWHADLVAASKALESSLTAAGQPVPTNTRLGLRALDRRVLNLAVQILESSAPGRRIAMVRGVFEEGLQLYPGAELWALSHVQIALRDSAITVDRWRDPGAPQVSPAG